jgi:hypothetical protein
MPARSALTLWLLLSSAGASVALECRSPQKEVAVAELMFGRNIGDRTAVSETQFTRFLDREISARFPDGLTVIDATGRWNDRPRHRIMREPSKVVTVVLHDDDKDRQRLDEIVAAYKNRFKQQSVGVMIRPACVSF